MDFLESLPWNWVEYLVGMVPPTKQRKLMGQALICMPFAEHQHDLEEIFHDVVCM